MSKAVAAGEVTQADRPGRPFTVGIVGAGSIGVGWALVFAQAGFEVRLHDPDAGRRAVVPTELTSRLASLAAESLLAEPAADITARVCLTEDLAAAIAGVSYVQECAPEALPVKRELFAQLDDLAAVGVVLASSSSALTASAITTGLPGAHRCLIAHPGNPPYLLPVVELVPGEQTTPEAMDAAENLMRRAGMTPIRLQKEIEGFVFNRLQGAVLREAYCLVRDGVVAPEDIDLVMRLGLGRRWSILGPFETSELNTRGGVDAHAAIMGPAYARMDAQREHNAPWEPELVARVAAGVQHRFPRSRWEDNIAWRDRALIALTRSWRERAVLSGPPDASGASKR